VAELSRRLFVLTAIAAVTLLGGCGGKKASGKPRVAVSIFPLYDVTRRIAGDRLDVVLVLPPGRSEHGYDPTPKEVARFEGARLGIAVGLGMDGWVEQVIRSAGGGARIVHLGDHVPTIAIDLEPIGEPEDHHDDHDDGDHDGDKDGDHDDHHHHGAGAPDPHFWMDPQRMSRAVDAIVAELTTLDPEGKAVFADNAATMKASLEKLDGELAARAKAWKRRTIVTFHGSMAYFAKRYGLRIAAVVEPLAGEEPKAQWVAQVHDAIKGSGAAALFSEPQLARGPAEAIAADTGVPLGELDPVGGVSGRSTYEELLRWNADQLDKVLK
jgi:zinc transport system substrate-binding protein